MGCNHDPIMKTCAVAGNTVVLLSRVVNADDEVLTQADVTSVRVDLYDITSGVRTAVDGTGTEVTDGSTYDEPDAADVVYDTLQTDSRWGVDSVGYNVAYKLAMPQPDKSYEVRVKITLANNDTLVVVYQITAK